MAWAILVLIIVLTVAGVILARITRVGLDGTDLEIGLTMFALLSFPAMGALIASRRSENAIGWLLLAIGVDAALLIASEAYADFGLAYNEGGAPGATLAAWFEAWLWFPLILIIPTFLPLLFPTGRLPSRRWRPVAWLIGAVVAAALLPSMVEGRLDGGGYNVPNPIGITSLGDTEESLFNALGPILLVTIVLSLASLVVRYRGGSSQERQQLKWVAFAVFALLLQISLEEALGLRIPALVFPLILMSLPASMAVAVLKYRLYEIDRIISRTAAYGVLTAILAGGYLILVLALQSLLPVSDDSPLIVAVSTLAVVAAFGPLRSRVQQVVDRRFNRTSYDAHRMVDAFGRRLRDEVELESLTHDLIRVVAGTMHPRHVSVWLKPGERV